MKYSTLFIGLLISLSCFAQNVAVLTHQAANSDEFKAGMPGGWPAAQPVDIGSSSTLPVNLNAQWVVMSSVDYNAQLVALKPALDQWRLINGTREQRKEAVGVILQERLEAGHWEPNRLRLHALESELFGKLMQGFRLNSELLLLVTKAVAGTAATNNLTAQERARVANLRPQLSFPQAPALTQEDRDRVVAITVELQKVEDLWKAARALRASIETNSGYVDPANGWPDVTVGE